MDLQIIRSSRKTLALEFRNGQVILRAPKRASDDTIQAFIKDKEWWIKKQIDHYRQACSNITKFPVLTTEEREKLYEEAAAYIPKRVAYFALIMGVTFGSVKIKWQKTRWGSCSSNGNLNFNALLMLAPDNVIDSVIVHELSHRKEMNHGRSFYDCVYRYCPTYKRDHRWLKENGELLLMRLSESTD